jgi:hypothetical protein
MTIPLKGLRNTRNGGGRARAVNGFTSSNAAINEIERQCHERNDFGHRFPRCLRTLHARRFSTERVMTVLC